MSAMLTSIAGRRSSAAGDESVKSAPSRPLARAATFLAVSLLIAACAPSAERKALDEVLTAEAMSEHAYVESVDLPEPIPADGERHSLNVSEFVDSLIPFVAYVEFGTGFESPEDQDAAFEEWFNEQIVVVGNSPSGYLMSFMWVLIAPPGEFQQVVLERELIDNQLTEWDPEQFSDRYPVYLNELAAIWLDLNAGSKPDWLTIRD